MALSSGTKLGPYEIVSPLGAGGMGEVYRGRDTRLERTVAIKVLPAHLSSSSDLKARFEREARAISSLNHPHICQLYDIGSQNETAYLVMEYIEGENLQQRLYKGALPLKQALELGAQVAEALATAHRAGILHRDLKPGNVMLTAAGVKLTDFGLAKPVPTLVGAGASGAAHGLTPSTPTMSLAALSSPPKGLTQQGTVVGTFQYMAPEVLQGAEADARSDIFSLGCVLYEMATGRRAFEGKSQLSVLSGILEKDPEPVSRIQPTSPPALDHVVKACLEKNPQERIQTAHDVKLQLQWIAQSGGQEAASKPARRYWRLGWLAASLAILIALGLAAAYVNLATFRAPVTRSFILPPAGTSFVTISPEAGPPALAPDGSRLAFSARDDQGKVTLHIRPLNSLAAESLAGTEDATYPFWSPDSREIGFFSGGKLKKIAASGGPPQTLCEAALGRGGTWSKEGVIVFSPGTAGGLLRVSAAGGTPEPASKLDVAGGYNSHRWPQFLPDGRRFLFWARSSRGAQEHTLYAGSLGSLDAKPVMKSELIAVYVPDYLLFMRDQTLLAQPFDAGRLQVSGTPVPVAEHVAINSATNRPIFSASDTGEVVYQMGTAQGGWRLLWFTREGKPTGAVGDASSYFNPALSPDGTRLATALFTGQGNSDIWIFDLARATRTRLTFGASRQDYPVWTPDGKTIYYASNRKGGFHIYAKAADGSGPEQVVVEENDAFEWPECFSPDLRYLAYTRIDSKTGADIWVLPLFGDRKPFPVVRTEFSDTDAAISPDGRWMAYQNNESGRGEVYLTGFPGGGAKWQVSTSGGGSARWRRDGKELFFLDPADNVTAVDVATAGNTVRLGTPHTLFHANGVQAQRGPYTVTADGKKFLVNSGEVKEESQPLTLVQNWPEELKKKP